MLYKSNHHHHSSFRFFYSYILSLSKRNLLLQLRTAIQGQLDSQEAAKSRRSSKSSRDDSDDEDDAEAPIDIGHLEIVTKSSPDAEYHLTNVHRRFAESPA